MLEFMEPYIEVECGLTHRPAPQRMPSEAAERLEEWVLELRSCGSLLMAGEMARHRVERNLRRVLEARRLFAEAWAWWRHRLSTQEELRNFREQEEARLALAALQAREQEEDRAAEAREAARRAEGAAAAASGQPLVDEEGALREDWKRAHTREEEVEQAARAEASVGEGLPAFELPGEVAQEAKRPPPLTGPLGGVIRDVHARIIVSRSPAGSSGAVSPSPLQYEACLEGSPSPGMKAAWAKESKDKTTPQSPDNLLFEVISLPLCLATSCCD
jgi:hypothetical protein